MVSVAIDPPPSSSSRGRRLGGSGRAALVGTALAAAFGGGFWVGRATAGGAAAATATAPLAAPAADGSAPPAAAPDAARPETPVDPAAARPSGAAPAPADGAPRRLVATVSGSVAESIAAALPGDQRGLADGLTAVVNRLLVWDLRLGRDGRSGDRLEVLWRPPEPAAGLPPGEPVVDAVRYASSKLGRVIAAYRFRPERAQYARYFREDGTELEDRLVDAPLREYEQITSLLRDGRRHEGVDFKTPVGSPVLATFDGVVERRNWNFAANGNCLDVRDPASGRHALYLHLDVLPKDMAPGRRVVKGQIIAASGNSGHSFAPHLHYQLEDAGGRVLDPFAVQRTERRALPASERPSFDAVRAKLAAALDR